MNFGKSTRKEKPEINRSLLTEYRAALINEVVTNKVKVVWKGKYRWNRRYNKISREIDDILKYRLKQRYLKRIQALGKWINENSMSLTTEKRLETALMQHLENGGYARGDAEIIQVTVFLYQRYWPFSILHSLKMGKISGIHGADVKIVWYSAWSKLDLREAWIMLHNGFVDYGCTFT